MKTYKESHILLIAGPFHPDDCGHCAECYLFSYQQKTTTWQRTGGNGKPVMPPVFQKYDVYLHRQHQMKHMDICIRYGEQDQYVSTYNGSFLLQPRNRTYEIHDHIAIAHDMIWKMKIDGMTAKDAFATLEHTRMYIDDN